MTNELLEEIKKRLRAYDEAKNVYEKDDARVAIEGQAHGDIEELVAEVERLKKLLGCDNPVGCPTCGEIREKNEVYCGNCTFPLDG